MDKLHDIVIEIKYDLDSNNSAIIEHKAKKKSEMRPTLQW